MKHRFVVFVGFGLAAAASVLAQKSVSLNEFVAVSSTAAPGYDRLRSDGSLRPESYVFAEGKFWEGTTVDSGLGKTKFTGLALSLATSLVKQSYFPVKDRAAADLMIVVHYGMSEIFDNPLLDGGMGGVSAALVAQQAAVQADGFGDPGPLNDISSNVEWAQGNGDRAMARNAALLGYRKALTRTFEDAGYLPEREKQLRTELAEERYFVVLMAYDNQLLLKEKKWKLQWVTRLSVRSSGNNFKEALPVMGQAGAYVFGRQVDDLVHVKANVPKGVIEVGPLQSLGVVESAPTNAAAPAPKS